jgi:predicted transcriptional regulator
VVRKTDAVFAARYALNNAKTIALIQPRDMRNISVRNSANSVFVGLLTTRRVLNTVVVTKRDFSVTEATACGKILSHTEGR